MKTTNREKQAEKEERDLLWEWMAVEDRFIPRLRISLIERAVYYHLLRHTRLEGKSALRFSIVWLARGARLSTTSARDAVRSLANKRALKIVERSRVGHVVEMLLPSEMAMCQSARPEATVMDLEITNCFAVKELREAIYRREEGRCFYCRRRLRRRTRVLDHVVARARRPGVGLPARARDTYRNAVACCVECNAEKGEMPAAELLRKLFREARLDREEFSRRLQALKALARGKLKPQLAATAGEREAVAMR